MTRALRFATLATLVLALPTPAQAEGAEAIFARANAALFRGDYEAARADYGRLRALGIDDPDVSFNAGLAAARLGRLGEAVRELEHTLRLEPGDEDATLALAQVQRVLGRRVAEREGEALVRTRPSFGETMVEPFSARLLTVLALVLVSVLFAALAGLHLTRREPLRIAFGIAAPLALVLFLLALGGLGVRRRWFERGQPAVVLAPAAVLREGPHPQAQARASVPEGGRAWVLDTEGEFVEVRLPTGQRGWMLQAEVGEI